MFQHLWHYIIYYLYITNTLHINVVEPTSRGYGTKYAVTISEGEFSMLGGDGQYISFFKGFLHLVSAILADTPPPEYQWGISSQERKLTHRRRFPVSALSEALQKNPPTDIFSCHDIKHKWVKVCDQNVRQSFYKTRHQCCHELDSLIKNNDKNYTASLVSLSTQEIQQRVCYRIKKKNMFHFCLFVQVEQPQLSGDFYFSFFCLMQVNHMPKFDPNFLPQKQNGWLPDQTTWRDIHQWNEHKRNVNLLTWICW